MKRNPIYQALRVSGVMQKLEDQARRSGAHAKLAEATMRDRRAVRSMWERCVIDFDDFTALMGKISRKFHARIIWDSMGKSDLRARLRSTRTIQRICPPGTSSYDFKMGKRRDVA